MATIKILTTILFVYAVSTEALKCYKSDKTQATCDTGENFCKTTTLEAPAASMTTAAIEKSCESTCSPGSSSANGASVSTKCCSTDLCNSDGINDKTCYVCSSVTGGCGKNGVDTSNKYVQLTTCKGTCVKTVIEGSQTLVARGCLEGNTCTDADTSTALGRVIIACCTGDKCNGGPTLAVTYSFIVVATVAAFILMRF